MIDFQYDCMLIKHETRDEHYNLTNFISLFLLQNVQDKDIIFTVLLYMVYTKCNLS